MLQEAEEASEEQLPGAKRAPTLVAAIPEVFIRQRRLRPRKINHSVRVLLYTMLADIFSTQVVPSFTTLSLTEAIKPGNDHLWLSDDTYGTAQITEGAASVIDWLRLYSRTVASCAFSGGEEMGSSLFSPSTPGSQATICPWANGGLAAVAAWPYRFRWLIHWSGPLHYATPVAPEHPSEDCSWGAC